MSLNMSSMLINTAEAFCDVVVLTFAWQEPEAELPEASFTRTTTDFAPVEP